MAVFGVRVKDSPTTKEFFSNADEKLQDENLVRNPFKGGVRKIGDLYIINMEPVYMDFSPFIMLSALATYLVWGFRWWTISLMCLSLIRVFWSRYFFYFFLRRGLKKKGYDDKIKLVKLKDIIKEGFFENGTNGDFRVSKT